MMGGAGRNRGWRVVCVSALGGLAAALCGFSMVPSRWSLGQAHRGAAPSVNRRLGEVLHAHARLPNLDGLPRTAQPRRTDTPSTPPPPAAAPRRWFDLQWEAAPQDVRRRVDDEVRSKACLKGFKDRYTTVLDPGVPFKPDPQALLVQLAIYRHQFCDSRACAATLYQMSKPFQGLGSRYHTHMCTFDHALRSRRPFVSLNGGWIFTEPSVCPSANDDCYFMPMTGCPPRFCLQAKDGDQLCARPSAPPPQDRCGENCLCGKCGTRDHLHELVWARHSCNDLREAPIPEARNRSHLWWTSQLMFYMLQPNEELNAVLVRDITADSPSLKHPIVNMHVRRGRLKQPEMARFFALDEYTRAAAPFAGRVGSPPRAFIQTNEPSVIAETRHLDKWRWSFTEWNRTGMDLQIHNDPKKVKRRKKRGWWVDARLWTVHSFRNLWYMVRSDYWVCTFSSNWCRLALRLAYATYGRLPPTVSLDAWGFDPYAWYGNGYVRKIAAENGDEWP